jgi:hypothetical protein
MVVRANEARWSQEIRHGPGHGGSSFFTWQLPVPGRVLLDASNHETRLGDGAANAGGVYQLAATGIADIGPASERGLANRTLAPELGGAGPGLQNHFGLGVLVRGANQILPWLTCVPGRGVLQKSVLDEEKIDGILVSKQLCQVSVVTDHGLPRGVGDVSVNGPWSLVTGDFPHFNSRCHGLRQIRLLTYTQLRLAFTCGQNLKSALGGGHPLQRGGCCVLPGVDGPRPACVRFAMADHHDTQACCRCSVGGQMQISIMDRRLRLVGDVILAKCVAG